MAVPTPHIRASNCTLARISQKVISCASGAPPTGHMNLSGPYKSKSVELHSVAVSVALAIIGPRYNTKVCNPVPVYNKI